MNADARFLLLAVRASHSDLETRRLVEAYRDLGPDRCRRVAEANRVGALVGAVLDGMLPPPGLSREWREAVQQNRARVESLQLALVGIFQGFQRRGVEAAVIEGGGMLLGTDYPVSGYGAGDFDILVTAEGFEAALDVVRNEGFEPVDRRGRPTTRVEHVRRGSSVELWIEVGHRPFDRMWLPLGFRDRSQSWLQARVLSPRVSGAHVLGPTEALVLCAAHASLHSYVRSPGLRLHIDTDRVARVEGIDWDHFVDEVILSQLQTRAFISLVVARGLLDTPVPPEVLQRLAPSPQRARRIVDLLRSERVVADGKPKLSRPRAVILDILLDDRGALPWLKSLLAPDRDWMREHFDRAGQGVGSARLHARRALALARRWRPE